MPRQTTPIGEWLSEECAQRGLSWAKASRRAGVDKSMISMIMRGQRPAPTTCQALAWAFQVPTEYVLGLAGHLTPSGYEIVFSPGVREIAIALEGLDPEVQEPLVAAWRQTLKAVTVAACRKPPDF